jgi:hypothetical protein
MSVRKIETTDKLSSGFRTKYNETILEIITAVTDLLNGKIRFTKFSGETFDVTVSGNTRYGKVTVEAGTQTITFDTTYKEGASWIFTGKPYLYDSDGNEIGYTITDRTITGFTITPVADGTLEYETIKI